MMRRWLKANPWIWLVFFFLFVLGINVAFVVIAVFQRPILVD